MKRYLWPSIALTGIIFFALLSYLFASGILEEYKHRAPKERNPEYVSLGGLRNYETQGYEYLAIRKDRALAVVYVIGTPLETAWGVGVNNGGSGDQITQIKAKVEEVLYGELVAGDEVYLRQIGNSKVMYTNSFIHAPNQGKTTCTDDCGGFFQKGERLLVSLQLNTMHKEDAVCGLHIDHLCAHVTEYSVRTVEKDGTLGYRKNSAFDPDSDMYAYLPFKIPYGQYNTMQEVRNAIPRLTVQAIEKRLGRKLSEKERVYIAKNNYKNALNVLCSGSVTEYIADFSMKK